MQILARLFAALALVSLVGCGGGSTAGTYKMDSAATQAANEGMKEAALADVPDAMKEAAEKMFTDMFANMDITMTLAEDGTVTGNMKMMNPMTKQESTETMTGTWTADGDKVTLTTKTAGSEEEDTVIATMDGDTLTAKMNEDGEDLTVILKRQ